VPGRLQCVWVGVGVNGSAVWDAGIQVVGCCVGQDGAVGTQAETITVGKIKRQKNCSFGLKTLLFIIRNSFFTCPFFI